MPAFLTLAEAIAEHVPDGASVALEGFTPHQVHDQIQAHFAAYRGFAKNGLDVRNWHYRIDRNIINEAIRSDLNVQFV